MDISAGVESPWVTSPIECGRLGDIFRFMLIYQELRAASPVNDVHP